ncbi:hypothetical protein EV702DRAFT_1205060 [Suillus placidus]|uniref:Uncharacterized protein n=1 Tax=Suillus placidus TaxID=48579 RepID=A0A9P6ZFU1_9AGAM|nr:hypothetical protein EV702DRAFT_1205060 [Suillus placidus]
MSGPLDAFGMPIRRTSSAPRFAGEFTQLVHFLEESSFKCGVDHYTRLIVEKLATAKAPHEAPLMCDPLHSECASGRLQAPAIAPKREKRDIILLPVVPAALFIEIASPPVHIEAPIMRAPPAPISNPEPPLATPITPHRKSSNIILAPVVPVVPESPFIEIISPIVLIEAPIARAPQEVQCDPEHSRGADIAPQHEKRDTNLVLSLLEAPLNENTPLMVCEDLKHPSLFSTPVQTRSAALEAHYATLFDQNMSRQTPLATDNFALFAFSAYSEYCLPVKHPCFVSPKRQLDDISDDPDAPPEHYLAHEGAQVSLVGILNTHPRPLSCFSHISCLKLSRSHVPVAAFLSKDCQIVQDYSINDVYSFPSHFQSSCDILDFRVLPFYHDYSFTPASSILPLPSHQSPIISLSTRLIRAPRALFPTLYAPIIAEESCLVHVFAYRVNFILAALTKGYPFWSWCQLALDPVSMRRARTVCVPYHSSSINAFTENQPILACLKSIVKNAPKRPKARMSRAPYHVVNHLSMHIIAFPWRAFNQERVVQEFIPPVTSPPAIAYEEDLDYFVGIDVAESEDEDAVTLSLHSPSWRALFTWQHRVFSNIDKEDSARAPVGDEVEEFDEEEPSTPSAPPFAPSTASPEPRYHQPHHALQALHPCFSQ